jgi:nucleoside-diphosphate-sugar epimerase
VDEFVTMDLAELPAASPLLADIDVVFHLAAKTHDMQEAAGVEAGYHRTNVVGTRQLLTAAVDARVRRFVFVSSVKAMDEGNVHPADETTPERPSTAYGRSKLEAERTVGEAGQAGRIEAVCLRFPLIYGPHQRGNLERMIGAIARGRFPPPPDNGSRRSMLHVENAADALMLAGTHPAAAGRTYIVTDERAYATREIYDAVRASLGRPPVAWSVPEAALRFVALAGDVARRVAGRRVGFDSDAFQKLLGTAVYDATRIRRELDYRPAYDLLGAMPQLVRDARAAAR